MDASDPVSCLLCLSAFERSTMLRVPLVPIGGDGPSLYYFCQRCGGAIAAEYLYIQNSGKPETTIEVESREGPSGETWDDGIAHEHEPGFMKPPIEEATTVVVEEKPVEVHTDAHDEPAGSKKKGRRDAR